MKIIRIDPENPDLQALQQAGQVLNAGGLVLHPTETVYGLAAAWDDPEALSRVAKLKERQLTQPFSIMVGSVEQIVEIAEIEDPRFQQFLQALFPAPVTVLLPRQHELSVSFWNQYSTLGFRLPEHQLSRKLVEMVGKPLITTSANLSGQPPASELKDVPESILNQVDLVLDGGTCLYKIPSTVIEVDWSSGKLSVKRKGAMSVTKIKEIFNLFLN